MHQSSVFVLSIAFQFALFGPGSSGPGSGCNVRCPGGPAEAARPQRHCGTRRRRLLTAPKGPRGPSPHRHSAPCNHHGPTWKIVAFLIYVLANSPLSGPRVHRERAIRTSQWGARALALTQPGRKPEPSDISRGGTGMGRGSDIRTMMHAPDPTRAATEPQSPMTPPATTSRGAAGSWTNGRPFRRHWLASSGPTVGACECQGQLSKQNVGLHVASTFITISDFALISATESLDNFDSQLEEQHEW
jgi:hypothetical protein